MINHEEKVQYAKSCLNLNGIEEIEDEIIYMLRHEVCEALRTREVLDKGTFDMAARLAGIFLRKKEQLPDCLAQFAADVLQGKKKRPKGKGKGKKRNDLIGRTMEKVAAEFNLMTYANRDPGKNPTAAEIVAKATGLSVSRVTAIFKEYKKNP